MDMHLSDVLSKDSLDSAEAEALAPQTVESTPIAAPAVPAAPTAPAPAPAVPAVPMPTKPATPTSAPAPAPIPSLRSDCMPLAFAHVGAELCVCKVMGPRATQQYVKSLGFVEDASVEVISFSPGGVIVRIMGSTFGVGSELARRIYVR